MEKRRRDEALANANAAEKRLNTKLKAVEEKRKAAVRERNAARRRQGDEGAPEEYHPLYTPLDIRRMCADPSTLKTFYSTKNHMSRGGRGWVNQNSEFDLWTNVYSPPTIRQSWSAGVDGRCSPAFPCPGSLSPACS